MPIQHIPESLKIIFIAFALVIFSLWLQVDINLNLYDEGFLWYGATQVLAGEIPVRDFHSYDPGRYYWAAFWMMLFGKGIISLRISVAIFQAIGLTFGLLVLKRLIHSWWVLATAGFILMCWMIPRHKIFESSIALAGVYFAYCLIKNTSNKQHFISGIFVGIAAFFGRNHALYNFFAFFFLILFIWFKVDKKFLIKRTGAWLGGIILGYSPMLIMILIAPGFFDSFVMSISAIINRDTTNLRLPIPWPWKPSYEHLDIVKGFKAFTTGIFFLLLPLIHGISLLMLILSKKNQLQNKDILIASTFIGIMYMHYAFARADLSHLAQGIQPFLITLFVLPLILNLRHVKFLHTSFVLILLLMTLLSAGLHSPYYWKISLSPKDLVHYNLNYGDHIWINKDTAQLIDAVKQINAQKVGQNEGFLIAPRFPMLYTILQRKSPIRYTYMTFPASEERQKKMIKDLINENVNWVFMDFLPLDGQKDLTFYNTYKFLWRYLKKNFYTRRIPGLPENYQLMRRKN